MSLQATGLLWAAYDQPTTERPIVDAAKHSGLETRFCPHGRLIEMLRGDAEVVVGIALPGDAEVGLALARQVQGEFPAVPVIVATADANVEIIRAAFRAGASDVISLPVEESELQKALIKAMTRRPAAAGAEAGTPGQVITILGARGGLGATTLAVNLAVQLAKVAQGNVALADLDLQRGDCAAFLNLTPSQSIATLAASGSAIDDLILFSTLIRHNSGLSLLAAPQHIEEADEVDASVTESVISRMRQRFRFTVVDTARTLTANTAAVLAHSDRVLIVTDLSLPGVRATHRLSGVLRGLSVDRDGLDLVIMAGEHDMVPVADASRAIGKPPLATLPRDAAAAAGAMNAGAPLNGPKPSPLLVAIIDLATKLAGVTSTGPAKRSLWRQIFAKGARA